MLMALAAGGCVDGLAAGFGGFGGFVVLIGPAVVGVAFGSAVEAVGEGVGVTDAVADGDADGDEVVVAEAVPFASAAVSSGPQAVRSTAAAVTVTTAAVVLAALPRPWCIGCCPRVPDPGVKDPPR
ncbi:hypothetical protein [Streptomyces poriticola]|uniref:hypothetical protein n=1 Tax=Streptomyces poriticola TaxID=3120506 RepID=UPI002FCDE7FE